MPVLSIGGNKWLGNELAEQMKLVADNVTIVVLPGPGHWILEERPGDDRCADEVPLKYRIRRRVLHTNQLV